MAGKTLLRQIIARLGYEFDQTNLKKYVKGTNEAIKVATKLGVAMTKNAKAGLDVAIKQQRLEAQKATAQIKKQKVEQEKLNRAIKKARLEKLQRQLNGVNKAQKKAARSARTMAEQLTRTASQVALAIGAMQLPKMAVGIQSVFQETAFRIRNLMGEARFKRIKKNVEEIKKATSEKYSSSELYAAADGYLTLDRNVARMTKSMEYAAKASPILKQSVGDISTAMGQFVANGGNIDELTKMGIFAPDYAVRLKKISNLTRREFKNQRAALLMQHLTFTEEQKRLAAEADKSLPVALKRAGTLVTEIGNVIGNRWGKWVTIGVNFLRRIKNTIDESSNKEFIYDLLAMSSGFAIVATTAAVLYKILKILGVVSFLKSGAGLFLKLAKNARYLGVAFRFLAGAVSGPVGWILLLISVLGMMWVLIKDTKLGKAIKEMVGTFVTDFMSALGDLKKAWESFSFMDMFNDIGEGFKKSLDDLIASWDNILAGLKKAWDDSGMGKIVGGISAGWEGVKNFFTGGDDPASAGKKVISQTSGASRQAISNTSNKTVQINMGGKTVTFEGGAGDKSTYDKMKQYLQSMFSDEVDRAILELEVNG